MANVSELSMLGKRLADLRVQHGYSQKELAYLLNLKPSIISAYENDTRCPSLSVIVKYSQLFHVSSDYILGISHNDSLTIDISSFSQKQIKILHDLVDTMTHE